MSRPLTAVVTAGLALAMPTGAKATLRVILTGTFAPGAPTTPYTVAGTSFKFAFNVPNFYSDLFYNNSKYVLTLGGKKLAQGEQQLVFNQDFNSTMPFYLPGGTIDVGQIVGSVASYGSIRKYGDIYNGYFFQRGNFSYADSAIYLPDTEASAPFAGLVNLSVSSGTPRTLTAARATPLGPLGGVPEPSIWAMMIAGLGMIGAVLRRKSAVAA